MIVGILHFIMFICIIGIIFFVVAMIYSFFDIHIGGWLLYRKFEKEERKYKTRADWEKDHVWKGMKEERDAH